jgi:hypothetical protein
VDGGEKGGRDGVCCILNVKVSLEESSPRAAVGAAGDNVVEGEVVVSTKSMRGGRRQGGLVCAKYEGPVGGQGWRGEGRICQQVVD